MWINHSFGQDGIINANGATVASAMMCFGRQIMVPNGCLLITADHGGDLVREVSPPNALILQF